MYSGSSLVSIIILSMVDFFFHDCWVWAVLGYSWFQEHRRFVNRNRRQTLFCFAHDNLGYPNVFQFLYLFHKTLLLTCLLFHLDPNPPLKRENGHELNHVIERKVIQDNCLFEIRVKDFYGKLLMVSVSFVRWK